MTEASLDERVIARNLLRDHYIFNEIHKMLSRYTDNSKNPLEIMLHF